MKTTFFSAFIFAILFFSFGASAHAASLSLVPTKSSFSVGDTLSVGVFVSTTDDNKAINALSGKIMYPTDKLSVVGISKTNSIINVWTIDPVKETSDVRYEGIVLNPGWSGAKGRIITITFKAKAVGSATFSFLSASVLANDGLGTNILDTTGTATITIVKAVPVVKAIPVKSVPVVVAPTPVMTITPVPDVVPVELPSKKFNISVSNSTTPITSYMITIDAGTPIPWTDDGTGIYTTPDLPSGDHTLTIGAIASDGTPLTDSITFTIAALEQPTIQVPTTPLYDGDFLIISGQGAANQTVTVYMRSEADTSDNIYSTLFGTASYVQNDFEKAGTVLADKNGAFTFVYDARIQHGTYMLYAISSTDGGIESKPSDTISFAVQRTLYEKILYFGIRGLLFFLLPFIGLLTIIRLIIVLIRRIHQARQSNTQ